MKEAARDDGVYTITLCGGQEQKVSFWKDSPVGTLLLNCDMTPDEGEKFLIVGQKWGRIVHRALNLFEGERAEEIYALLTSPNEKMTGEKWRVKLVEERYTTLPVRETLLVGYDFTHGEERKILVVARKEGKNVRILNAFEGKAADDIFKLLTTRKDKGGLEGRLGVEDSAESAPQTPYPANAEGRLTGEEGGENK